MARILIVENNAPVRLTLASLLAFEGHEVVQAADGQQALTNFAARSFDAVLLGVYLPHIDGLEACRRLRQESQVPILMISTNGDPLLQQLALGCGANAFWRKPLEFDRLLAWVRQACERECYGLGGLNGQLHC